MANNLKVPQNQVRVICEYLGGGFGSTLSAGAESGIAARLSKAAKAPVKLMLPRFDEALAVGNRPSTFQKIRLGASADGKLQAIELENYGTPGIGGGDVTEGASGDVGVPAPFIYRVPNSRVKQASVAVNAGVGCAGSTWWGGGKGTQVEAQVESIGEPAWGILAFGLSWSLHSQCK